MRAVTLVSGLAIGALGFGCSSSSTSNPGTPNDVDGGSMMTNPGHDGGTTTTGHHDGGGTMTGGNDSGTSSGGDDSSTPPITTDGVAPEISGCKIFPDDNAWNMRIDDTSKFPIHSMNSTYMSKMHTSTGLHPDWGDWTHDKYGIPWAAVPGTQPTVAMKFSEADQSDPGPYPFPADARIEPGDGHVLILDTGTCMLYETYLSKYNGSTWSCSSGAKFDLSSDALRPDGWTSADAAGLSVFAGLVKLSEVQSGAIHHAIRFSVSSTQNAYIHPATHAAGDTDTSLPPMGLRMRLKSSFSLSSFSGASLVVATALQQYGVILADNGSDWYITGDSDDGWSPLMGDLVDQLGKIKGSDFEAVESGALSSAGL